jgi:hypothetical protein
MKLRMDQGCSLYLIFCISCGDIATMQMDYRSVVPCASVLVAWETCDG